MADYILAIDQSTSSAKAILFNRKAELICRKNVDHAQIYPRDGWVEHDPVEIAENVRAAAAQVMEETGVSVWDICALGISNQRETVVVWNRNTGRPVGNAIVWQCPRAADICKKIEETGAGEEIRLRSGIVLSPYFPAAKIRWILDHTEGARMQAKAGELVFGTMDTWLLWSLTGGSVFATDYSNASRTQLFHLREKCWDPRLFQIFDIPMSMAPEIRDSGSEFGVVSSDCPLKGLPIMSCLGDSHAALFGQNCFERGMTKITYGTGSSIMMNIGAEPVLSEHGLVTSVAWGMNGQVEYVFEGNLNSTGDTLKWMKDNMNLIQTSAESEEISGRLPGNGGVYLVPAFVGLGAPYWDSEAQALIVGMKRSTTWEYIVRAAVESIAYQIKDITDLMQLDSNSRLRELRVDGGPTNNHFLMQMQADLCRCRIACARIEEISALGAAFMAGITAGFWKDKEELKELWEARRRYDPEMDEKQMEKLYDGWKKAVARAL